MKLRQNVFVYGTLKRGFYNYDAVLARQPDAAFVAEGVTTERFPLFVDHYKIPYLVHRAGEGRRVAGELFAVGPEGLAALDALEGVDEGRYARREVDVDVGDSSKRAWLYSINDAPLAGRALLPAYTAAIHAAYTPPGDGRDPALFRPWGGYEP